MVPDERTNTVFISDLLAQKHSGLVAALTAALGDKLRTILGTKDIWCRDYMPIQLSSDRFVQFRYDPDYLKDDPQLRTDDGGSLTDLSDYQRSDLVIDGGNVVRGDDTVILTDKVYRENLGIERPRLRDELRRILEVERLVVIPKEPFDIIGHSDGIVRFVDETTFLVNDYREVDPDFGEKLAGSLRRHGFEMIAFPYRPTGKVLDGIASAEGVYINFLQVEGLIVCPIFQAAEDERALRFLEQVFPRSRILPFDCRELATGGGVLNCVTWNIFKA
jgi:agmatine deiminase